MTKVVPWNNGTGNITIVYTGIGNDTVTVTSDANNLSVARSQTITLKTTNNAASCVVTIAQAAMAANFVLSDGNYLLLSDGNYFNVVEQSQ